MRGAGPPRFQSGDVRASRNHRHGVAGAHSLCERMADPQQPARITRYDQRRVATEQTRKSPHHARCATIYSEVQRVETSQQRFDSYTLPPSQNTPSTLSILFLILRGLCGEPAFFTTPFATRKWILTIGVAESPIERVFLATTRAPRGHGYDAVWNKPRKHRFRVIGWEAQQDWSLGCIRSQQTGGKSVVQNPPGRSFRQSRDSWLSRRDQIAANGSFFQETANFQA